jgi:hypothetical protein
VKHFFRFLGVVLIGLGLLELFFWEPNSLFSRHPELHWLQEIADWMRWVMAVVYLGLGILLVRQPLFFVQRYKSKEPKTP